MKPPALPKPPAFNHPRRRLLGGLGASALLASLPGCGGPSPGWSPPLAAASASGQASGLRVVWGEGGSALAVWETETAGVRRVMAAWLDSTESTPAITATALDAPDSGAPRLPDAALDASGRAWVVWRQALPAGGDWVLARRHEPGAGWLPVELLGPAASGADRPPRVAMDGSGGTTATWLRDSPAGRPVVARTWLPGGPWSPEQRLDALNDTATKPPAVTVDGRGHGIVVWPQRLTIFDGPFPPWGSDVDPGAVGSITGQVETLGLDADLMRLVTLSGGQALLAWRAIAPPGFSIVGTSLYTPGVGWSAPLQPSGTVASIPALALTAGPANASAVWWVEGDGGSERLLLQRLAGAAAPFDPPWTLVEAAAGTRLWPQGVMTRAGEVVSLWESGPSGTTGLWTSTQPPGAAPGPAQRLDEGSAAGVSASGVARGPADRVVAAWTQPVASGHRLWLRWWVP